MSYRTVGSVGARELSVPGGQQQHARMWLSLLRSKVTPVGAVLVLKYGPCRLCRLLTDFPM
jgi:hypothetical protein